jgi:hypothetical protein
MFQRTWSKYLLLVVGKPLSQVGVRINSWRFNCSLEMHSIFVLANQSRQMKHLVPRSHKFQTHFSLSQIKATEIMAFRENYTQPAEHPKDVRTVMADSQVVNCNRFSYQQVIHILPSLQAPSEYSSLKGKDGINLQGSNPFSKSEYPVC